MKRTFPMVLLFSLWAIAASATELVTDFEDVDLEDLLDVEVTVASRSKRTLRQSPGVVTVIKRSEIERSGARDLIDVLRLVPGFHFGADVQGAVGAGFRGNWGHEGKILLLIDGIELNENAYATLQFGHHFSVEQIHRVEVIRGPGSIIYGGFAELAVVNIITRDAADLQGLALTGQYGQTPRGFARRTLALSAGDRFESLGGLETTVHLFVGQGNRSDRTYTDVYGDSFDMQGASRLDPLSVNAAVAYKGLRLRFLYDSLNTLQQDAFDEVQEQPIRTTFKTYAADANYSWHVSDKLTITPRLTYKYQQPWRSLSQQLAGSDLYFDSWVQRLSGSLFAIYKPWNFLTINAGIGGHHDMSDGTEGEGTRRYGPGGLEFYSGHALLEGLLDTSWVNVALGARYEWHNQFGDAFVPRLAITRTFGDAHVKALASRAFRAPSIENITLNADIEPELTTVFELEVGYRILDSLMVTANVFDITIHDPIVYFFDDATGNEGYENFRRTGTSGAEAAMHWELGAHLLRLGYSYYTPNAFLFGGVRNDVDSYEVPGSRRALLGFAPHKVTLNTTWGVLPNLFVNLNGEYLSSRFGYDRVDENDEPILRAFSDQVLLNVFVRWENILVKGLWAGAGVFDLVGNQTVFIQPYNGFHAPLFGASREFVARMGYQLAF